MEFVLPDYRGATLSNLLPSIAASLDGAPGPIEIPEAARYVILLVDGLGLQGLEQHADHADVMATLLPDARTLTCSVPSTTATSLTSLGCGTWPGRHGVVGYTFLDPSSDKVLNALSWEGGPERLEGFKLAPTLFESFSRDGIGCAAVSLARFGSSALTQLAFGGTNHFGIDNESDPETVVDLVTRALDGHRIVYCYERLLDHAGHGWGIGSWQWLEQLARVDDLVSTLRATLDDDVCLLITGDHGMVNVPQEHRIVVEDHAKLLGFRHIAGEGRFRQLYCDDAPALKSAWSRFLGERGDVVLREEAEAAGWFGPSLDSGVVERVGDVLVAMRSDWAVMTRTFPREFDLVGMHGSLTVQEMLVPLLVAGPS